MKPRNAVAWLTPDHDIEALERVAAQLRRTRDMGVLGSSTYDIARRMYKERRERESVFTDATALFGEPSWDMLLDLFIARAEGKRVSVSDACIAAIVPPTTALRWIDSLVRHGLIERENDPADRRRSFLVLTAKGVGAMDSFFRMQ